MKAIKGNEGPSPQQERPVLSINTNVHRKSWKSFFHSPTVLRNNSSSSSLPILNTVTTNSLSNNSSQTTLKNSLNPSTTNSNDSSKELPNTHSQHQRAYSLDTSNNSNISKKAVLKKLHLPTLLTAPAIYNTKTQCFEPVAPEPIMPSIVDWSPEMPISPPPWEIDDDEYDTNSSASSSLLRNNSNGSSKSGTSTQSNHSNTPISSITSTSSMTTLVEPSTTFNRIRRRSSCPNINPTASMTRPSSSASTISSSSITTTLVEEENDIISITQAHTRNVSLLKRNPIIVKNPTFKKCQKVKAKAAEAAAQGEVFQHNSIFSTFCDEHLKYLYIPNVFDPVTREPILKFASIKPRKYQLHRKTSWKREAKSLLKWHHILESKLHQPFPIPCLPNNLPPEKADKSWLTRRFILREFFTTEVNFWNQLYYTKMVFYDALEHTLMNQTGFAKPEDADIFANLFDLMQFSAKLINLLRRFQIHYIDNVSPSLSNDEEACAHIECNNLYIGQKLVDMSEDLVVFLRCAIDYRENRKQLDATEQRAGFTRYRELLFSKKETSQFTMNDYLIIPIQRVARYVLLITDLIKHTPTTHPDYPNLVKSYQIITSLGTAMDLVQKKPKKK